MDFKSNDQKHPSTSIPYVRTRDTSNGKSKSLFGCLFRNKISLISLLASITSLVCFILMLVYINLQASELTVEKTTLKYSEPLIIEEKEPITSRISISVDPKLKSTLLALETDEKYYNYPVIDDGYEKNRLKRQIPQNIPDCRGKQEECRIVLQGVRGITKTINKKMDHFHRSLVQQGILKDTDPKDAKYKKILECLQCRNTINSHEFDDDNTADDPSNLPGFSRHYNDDYRINEILPFFERYPDSNYEESNEDDVSSDERTDRVPKHPAAEHVLKSETDNSKITNNENVTEFPHDTTNIEDKADKKEQESIGAKKYTFYHRPVEIPDPDKREEVSQVTRNMDGSSIFPTVETTKTSQQIQFMPQAAAAAAAAAGGSWPTIPVCFYGPPSLPNSYQFKNTPGSPLFMPYPPPQVPMGMNQNQQMKYFSNNQPQQFPLPTFSPMQQTAMPQFPIMGQQPFSSQNQQNMQGYYCTYIPAPMNYQQQQQLPPYFPSPFLGARSNDEEKSRDMKQNEPEIIEDQKQQNTEMAKSASDGSDEKYSALDCPGFWCKGPYRKCLQSYQRCDGRVDCMGAEDEIDCPTDGYYSRFHSGIQTFTVPPFSTTTEDQQSTSDETNTETIATDPSTNPVTESSESPTTEIETTTYNMVVPDMPERFTCKRIIQTISMEQRCDNVFDCEDTSDEEDCSCKDYLKIQHPTAICDGHVDCYDGTDEQDCDFCNNDQYHCHRSGGCIPKRKKCNHNMDCKLNEDELDCYALTDGNRINLDFDKRPHLNLEGVLTHYENGAWRPSCFKSVFKNDTKKTEAAQRVCEYLGFKTVDYVDEVTVRTSKLIERSQMKDFPVPYEYPPHFTSAKNDNKTCNGLYLRCKPILDRKVNVHLKVDPKTKERTYQWPWEASIFVNGKYHCSAVLLENNLLLSSSECSEGIDLKKNYTIAILGASTESAYFNSPYQQISPIIDIKQIKNSDATLFRLKDSTNMTRHVQPLYLEKRIYPASKNDACVALGVNANHERKMKFLHPVVDNCPKCHRCYIDNQDTTCSMNNATTDWSGNVVCLSNGGWYPAAVFQDKDESCGFGTKQVLNSIDYIHAHLTQAIDEQVEPIEEPKCEGIRCTTGQCITWDRVCDGVRHCQDGADENREQCQKVRERCDNDVLECKCTKAELRCGNGKCIPKEKFCDRVVDCEDGTDEPASCNCGEYLKLTEPKRVCDGVRHCLDKTDENYQQCYCKDSSFKCERSFFNGTMPCIPQDFVCDGEKDCPEGEDEDEHVCWTIKNDRRDPKGKGEVMRRAFGVLQSECYPRPIQSQREVTNTCARLGYTSGILIDGSKVSESQYLPRNDFYMFQLNSYSWITMRPDQSFAIWKKPEDSCYRLFVQCFN